MLSAQLKTLKIEFNLRLDKIESELILLKVKRSSQHRDVATRLAHTNPTKSISFLMKILKRLKLYSISLS